MDSLLRFTVEYTGSGTGPILVGSGQKLNKINSSACMYYEGSIVRTVWGRQLEPPDGCNMPIESALDMLCSEIARLLREFRLLFGFAVLTEVDGAVMLHSGAFLSTI